MLRTLSGIPNREIYIFSKSPLEQYSNTKIKIKELGEVIEPLNEHEFAIIVFDDVSGSSNSESIDQFCIRARHNNLDISYLSKYYFDSPKRTFRNNSNRIILYNQTRKDLEKIYRDVGGYDMSYDQPKGL